MNNPAYLRQTDQPLFPKILWNRPVNRTAAGRLLIVGGHSGDFSQVEAAYQIAQAAGVGLCRVLLPDVLARTVAGLPDALLAPSTPSGSLGRSSLSEILQLSQDYDAVLLGLNWSNNSEASILAESLVSRLSGNLVVAGDALDALKFNPTAVTKRDDCLIVADMRQAFRLAGTLKVPLRIAPDAGIINQAAIGQAIATAGQAAYLIHDGWLMAATPNQVSLTELHEDTASLSGAVSGLAGTLWLQNPGNRFEAVTSACYLFAQAMTSATGPNLAALAKAISQTLDHEDFI